MSVREQLERLFDEHLDIKAELLALLERERSPFIQVVVPEEPRCSYAEYPELDGALMIYAEEEKT